MEDNLEFLNKARSTYSQLMVEVGLQYMEEFPQADPEEFVETFLPPREGILESLTKERTRIESKKRLKQLKIKRKAIRLWGRFRAVKL